MIKNVNFTSSFFPQCRHIRLLQPENMQTILVEYQGLFGLLVAKREFRPCCLLIRLSVGVITGHRMIRSMVKRISYPGNDLYRNCLDEEELVQLFMGLTTSIYWFSEI